MRTPRPHLRIALAVPTLVPLAAATLTIMAWLLFEAEYAPWISNPLPIDARSAPTAFAIARTNLSIARGLFAASLVGFACTLLRRRAADTQQPNGFKLLEALMLVGASLVAALAAIRAWSAYWSVS